MNCLIILIENALQMYNPYWNIVYIFVDKMLTIDKLL